MFKKLKEEDVVTTISPINETVFLTRTYFSGGHAGTNRNFSSPLLWTSSSLSGGLFIAVYDRSPTESPSQKLSSITYGYTTGSGAYEFIPPLKNFPGTNREEKLRIYRLFAQKLLGDKNSLFEMNGVPRHELIFLSMNRNIFKDRIKEERELEIRAQISCSMGTGTANEGSWVSIFSNHKIRNSPGGDFVGLTKTGSATENALCFMESGIFVIDPLDLIGTHSLSEMAAQDVPFKTGNYWSGTMGYDELAKGVSGSTFDDLLFAIRHRIRQVSFVNESRMRTTFLGVTAEADEFNYSTNPSYLKSDGSIKVLSGSSDLSPRTYITTIAFANKNDEILAIGKLQKPTRKDFKTKISITVRLDY